MRRVLRTEHLVLRPAEVDEVAPIVRACNAVSQERIDRLVQNNAQWWGEHNYGVWVLLDPETEAHVGWCGLRPGSAPTQPELMYGLTPAARGRGLAQEAARAVLSRAFSAGMQSVWAATDPANTRSVRVMERIGMKFERRADLDGLDSVIYRIQNPAGPLVER